MTEPAPPQLPARASDTTIERPWPVRHLSEQIARYVDRMPALWVEGQVVQFTRRNGTRMAFITLRDTDIDMSLPVAAPAHVVEAMPTELTDGAHVVMHAKPTFWAKRGSLQLSADSIRPLGVGELLARIEQLKRILAAEGLFAPDRKRPLPFLPNVVGLICGRDSKAEHDVVVNARARWPEVQFVIKEVAVQGVNCVPEVSAALTQLDADPHVDVIVVARGGGAVEDLLPFSNEALIRVAAACTTPIVSAIGHETDAPLLDLVADVRASTPTDAAKRIVPDVAEEQRRIQHAAERIRHRIRRLVDHEAGRITALRARPVLGAPTRRIDEEQERLDITRDRTRRAITGLLATERTHLEHLTGQLRGLSPGATLRRGYAIVLDQTGNVVRSADDVQLGDTVHVRLSESELDATTTLIKRFD